MDRAIVASKHYRMPHNDNYTFYIPDCLSIIEGDRDTAYIVDCCSVPVTIDTLHRRLCEYFNDKYSPIDIANQIHSLLNANILYYIDSNILYQRRTLPQIDISVNSYKSITLLLTDQCNLQCKYCYNKSERDAYHSSCLQCSQWIAIISDIIANKSVDILEFTLSGGEPFLYSDIEELLKYLRSTGHNIGVITNGTLIRSDIVRRSLHLVNQVTVSLDSQIEEINDATRGSGTYRSVVEFIDYMERNKIHYNINSVLTSVNIDSFSDTYLHLKRKYRYLREIASLSKIDF